MDPAAAIIGAVSRFIFRHGKVTAVERLTEHFTRIDVAGKGLEGASFDAGDKVQVYLAGGKTKAYWAEGKRGLD